VKSRKICFRCDAIFFSHIFQCGFHEQNYYNVSSYTLFVIENKIGCVHTNMIQPCHLGECLFQNIYKNISFVSDLRTIFLVGWVDEGVQWIFNVLILSNKDWVFFNLFLAMRVICCNPTLKQVWRWDSHSQKWELGVLRDSRNFRTRL
jgi:hypothetical protein